MPSNTPLKARLEPGDYQCYAHLPDGDGGHVRLEGMLSLESGRPPELTLYGDLLVYEESDGLRSADLPQISHQSTLRVDLVNGMDVILLDCIVTAWPGAGLVQGSAALVGRFSGNAIDGSEPLLNGLRMQVTGCDAVGSPPPLKSMEIPIKLEPDRPATWSATERIPRETGVSDDLATVTAGWDCSTATSGYEQHVSFSPVWEVKLVEPVLLRQMVDDWVLPLRGIVALSTGRREKITYVELTVDDGDRHRLQVFGATITQQPYASNQNEIVKTKRAFICYGANESPQLLDLCRSWQAAIQARHPLIESFAAFMFIERQHPRPRFLLLMQALEGLYGHEHKAQLNARDRAYAYELVQALAAIEACDQLDAGTKRFLKKKLPRRPITNLEETLKVVVGELPVDLSGDITALELVKTVIANADNHASDWAAALRVVRNHLSHGTQGWDPDLLKSAADLLEIVARAHLMRTIGVPDPMIRSFLDAGRS